MFTLNSKYDNVVIYAETIEQEAISQITQMANSPIGENAHIRIMPDAHAGAGCVIGTTMQFNGKVCPNIVGVDIGCGVIAYHLTCTEVDLEKLDKICREVIVSGQAARQRAVSLQYQASILSDLYCWEYLRKKDYLYKSLGTLGGGWR